MDTEWRGDEPEQLWKHLIDSKFAHKLYEKYAPVEWLLEGGYGRVGRVLDEHLARDVCIKTPKTGARQSSATDQEIIERFLFEAYVTANLRHPGVPPVHEVGCTPSGLPYYTTKWIRGKTLYEVSEECRSGKRRWSRVQVISVLMRVCDAMEYAHRKGVLHRDLTYSNIMTGRFGEVYVLDWGLAKIWNTEAFGSRVGGGPTSWGMTEATVPSPNLGKALVATAQGQVVGTPFFLAPEIIRSGSQQATPQSDVYSLGACLYHLLCGRLPYEPETGALSVSEYVSALADGLKPEPLAGKTRSPELASICAVALAHEPSERYASIADLKADLARALLVERKRSSGFVRRLTGWWRGASRRYSAGSGSLEPDSSRAIDSRRLDGKLEPGRLTYQARMGGWSADVLSLLRRIEGRTMPLFQYELLGEIGWGGAAVVYRAYDQRLGRECALKRMREGFHEEAEMRQFLRFLTEAQVAAQLDHPDIVAVHEVGVYPRGRPYIVMDLIEGVDLSVLAGASPGAGKLDLLMLVSIVQRASEALAYAHDIGIVHRDIKPSNIVIGTLGQVCVVDWGLAYSLCGHPGSFEVSGGTRRLSIDAWRLERLHADAVPLYCAGEVNGTPMYMAPEQVRFDPKVLSGRSDVFALGCTLWEIVTGHAPYDADNLSELFGAKARGKQLAWRPGDERVPMELVDLCRRATSPASSDRPSAKAFATELRQFLEHPPLSVSRWRPCKQ